MAVVQEFKVGGTTVRIHDDYILPPEEQKRRIARVWNIADAIHERVLRDEEQRREASGN